MPELPIPDHPFTAREAFALGFSPDQLHQLLRAGAIRQILYGVYVPADWPDDITGRAAAAAHVMPPHAVLADRSAAAFYGIDVHELAETAPPADLEIVSVDGAVASRRSGVRGGQRSLTPDEILEVGGVRVTSPARTACDIACMWGRHRAIATLDAFRTELGLTEAELLWMLPRFRGRRGVTQLRELIPLSRAGVDSQPESWVRLDLHDAGYPMPETQVRAFLPDWGMVRMENAYPSRRVAVEYDGEEDHSEDDDRERDDARRAAARRAGWHIVVVQRDGFSGTGRQRWQDELRMVWRDREPLEQQGRRRYAAAPRRVRPANWRR